MDDDYGESDWYRLAFEFKNINTTSSTQGGPKFAWISQRKLWAKPHFLI